MLPRLSQLRAPSLRRVVLIQPWAPSRDYSAASKSRRRSPTSPASPSSPPPRIAAEPPTSGPSTQEPRITSHPKPWTRPEPPLVAAARAKSVKQRSVWESYLVLDPKTRLYFSLGLMAFAAIGLYAGDVLVPETEEEIAAKALSK